MSDFDSTGESGGAATAVASPDSGSPATAASSASSSAGTSSGTEGTQPAPGPIPYERFSEVNTKYNQLRWAEGLDGATVKQQQQFFQWLNTDPEGAFRYMEDYLTRSGALKRQAKADAADVAPQPDVVVPETGQRFYSAEAAERLAEWKAKQIASPLEQRLQSIEQTTSQARLAAQANALLTEAQSWPYFKEHQVDVLRAMEQDHRLSLEGAYNRVVVPKLKNLERQAVLSELNHKSQASTVNPASAGSSARGNPAKQSWTTLFRAEMAKRGGQV